jgi:tRNA (mo5U34)-methyltransferase
MADVTAELQLRASGLPWHHSIDLGRGVVTAGNKSLALCTAEAELIFDRLNLRGCSVLDIGAWNGYFSFEARRRGAERVLATDSYCWTHPHIRGREAFELARSTLGMDVDACEIDVADLSRETVGEFDVVLYLGVFYHRYDAIEALAKVARLAKQVLIVETHLELRDVAVPAMAFFPGRELANDPTNWWGPNEFCIKDLLLGHGFNEVEISAHPEGHNRAIFHAWRSTDARVTALTEEKRLKPLADVLRAEARMNNRILKMVRAALRPLRRILPSSKY